jgi:hypothetical protein
MNNHHSSISDANHQTSSEEDGRKIEGKIGNSILHIVKFEIPHPSD